MKLSILALLMAMLAIMLVLVAADEDIEYPKEVVRFTQDNFLEEITKKEFAYVEFYAPWCGHCKHLAPEYSKAAKLGRDNLVFGVVNCVSKEAGELCQTAGIQGFPTVQLWKNGKFYKEFSGERTADGLLSWFDKKSEPSVKVIASEDEAMKIVDANKVTVIGRNMADNDIATLELAGDAFEDFKFVAIRGDGKAEYTLYGRHLKKNEKSVYDSAKFPSIADWLKTKGFPLVGVIDQNTFARYDQSGVPLLFLFTEMDNVDKNVPLVEPAAEKHAGVVNVGYIDGVQWKEQLTLMGFEDTVPLPQVAILDISKQLSYPFFIPEGKTLTADMVTEFLDSFVAGNAKPFLRSEDEPEEPVDEHNVRKLVGKSFSSFVENKNVFVIFYAPWCGHCQTMKKPFEALATHLKPINNLVIGKMDATQNDVTQVTVEGFPTLYLFKSDNTKLVYEGKRTGADMLDFIKANVDDASAAAIDKLPAFVEPEEDEASDDAAAAEGLSGNADEDGFEDDFNFDDEEKHGDL